MSKCTTDVKECFIFIPFNSLISLLTSDYQLQLQTSITMGDYYLTILHYVLEKLFYRLSTALNAVYFHYFLVGTDRHVSKECKFICKIRLLPKL